MSAQSQKAANVRTKLSSEFVSDGSLLIDISRKLHNTTAEIDAMLGDFSIESELSMAPESLQKPNPAEESVAEVKRLFDSYKSHYLQALTP